MNKKILTLSLIASLLLPQSVLAMSSAANNLPADTSMFFNFNLTDFQNEILPPFQKLFDEQKNNVNSPEALILMENTFDLTKKQLEKDLFMSLTIKENGMTPVGGIELAPGSLELIKKLFKSVCADSGTSSIICPNFPLNTVETINEDEYNESSFLNIDDRFLYFGEKKVDLEAIKNTFAAQTGSLGISQGFQELKSKLDNTAVFWAYLDYRKILMAIGSMNESDSEFQAMLNNPIISTLGKIGVSVKKEAGNNLTLKAAILGNREQMDLNKIYFDSLSDQVEMKLYRELPNRNVLAYLEQGNPFIALESLKNIPPYDNVFTGLEREANINLNDLSKTLNKNLAIAVQSDNNNALPYISILAEVGTADRDTALSLSEKIAASINARISLYPEIDGQISNTKIRDGFYKLSVAPELRTSFLAGFIAGYFKNLQDNPFSEVLYNAYAHDNSANIELYYGLTTPALFVITNDSALSGFDQGHLDENNKLIKEIGKLKGLHSQFGYLSLENTKKHLKNKIYDELMQRTPQTISLAFYKEYFNTLNSLNYIPEITFSSLAERYSQALEINASYNLTPNESFSNFINSEKNTDTDDDGISDFKERFVEFTDPYSADSDRDGINDLEELAMGENPGFFGRTFNDVNGDEWFAPSVHRLNRTGSISGYERNHEVFFDGSKTMNRAEFTKMVVKAFNIPISAYTYNPFKDIDENDWYLPYVMAAYNNGIVNGRIDEHKFYNYFDGEKEITRAEALTMISRAANLSQIAKGCVFYAGDYPSSILPPKCENTYSLDFEDIDQDSFYSSDLLYAYELGIITGTGNKFYPNNSLNRAEAAKILSRALDAKNESLSEESDKSLTDNLIQGSVFIVPILLNQF